MNKVRVIRVGGKMLNHIETIFDDMSTVMIKLKKLLYENNMEVFRDRKRHFLGGTKDGKVFSGD